MIVAPIKVAPMSRIGLIPAIASLAMFGASASAQAVSLTAECEGWRLSWEGGVGAGSDAEQMVDTYKRIPRMCVAERAQALLRIGQVARETGRLLEADETGAPVIRRVAAAPPPPPPSPIISGPIALAPPAPTTAVATLIDDDLTAAPGRRDYANAPSALERLGDREVVIIVSGVLRPDGSFQWAVDSETPRNSGLASFALRLADRYRARTQRPDGASTVGGRITRTFRFRGP
jgi:hypothetical protein